MLNQGYVYREVLTPAARGATVLDYLERRYPHSSREEWAARIREGRVRVNGVPARLATKCDAGQTLSWHRPPWAEPESPLGFAVLHQDRDVLALAKPRGLPTLPGGGYLLHTLLSRVRSYDPGASPLHRLGRGTSGVILFARHRHARSVLTAQWQGGKVRRRYLALVRGVVEGEQLRIDVPIGRVPHGRLGSVYAAHPGGRAARSEVRVLERRRDASLVAVELVTGRAHQIRIHLAAVGHPLTGDPLYPPGGVPRSDATALPGEAGYWLHAETVGFHHPRTGDWLEVTCAPPPVLRSAVTDARGKVS